MGILEALGNLVGSEESKKRQEVRDNAKEKQIELKKEAADKKIRTTRTYKDTYSRYMQYCFDRKEDIPQELIVIDDDIKTLKEDYPGVETDSKSLALQDIKKEYVQDPKTFEKKLEEDFNISEDKKEEIRKTADYIGHYDRYVTRIYQSGFFDKAKVREMSKELSASIDVVPLKDTPADYQAKRIALDDIINDAREDTNKPLLKTQEGYKTTNRYIDRLLKPQNKRRTEEVFTNITNELDDIQSENDHTPRTATRLAVLKKLENVYQEVQDSDKLNFSAALKKIDAENKNQLKKLEEYKFPTDKKTSSLAKQKGNASELLSKNAQPVDETASRIHIDSSKSK